MSDRNLDAAIEKRRSSSGFRIFSKFFRNFFDRSIIEFGRIAISFPALCSGPRCDLNVEHVTRYRPYSMPDLTARLHAIHVYTYTNGDVCRSNRNGIPRINNALYVVLLGHAHDRRRSHCQCAWNKQSCVRYDARNVSARVFALIIRSVRARACVRTHARTHACSRESRSNWNGIQANNANTYADKTALNKSVHRFRAFRYYFKHQWKSICFSLSLSL